MSQAEFIIGRFDWAKNRGGAGSETFQLRSGRTGRAMGNVRGLPQVVFKVVPNGGCTGPRGLAAQLDYVLGKAEHVIDPNREYDRLDHLPAEFTSALAKDWAEGWERRVKSGHSMHMVASFPNGTDPEKVTEIMRATCFDIFDQGRSRFNYIAAMHNDTGRPHVHIVVDRRNAEGEWFYFARDGEFTYDLVKDTIVAHAATYGTEMVNSSRLSRGIANDAAESRDRAKNPALRGLSGTLAAHGAARYRDDPAQRMSYFVTVDTPHGAKTLWGKELGPVMAESGAQQGDAIRVTHEGKVPVEVRTRDGRVIETHRNQWAVSLPDRDISTAAEKPAPSAGETRSAEWKRAEIRAHAADYRALSVAFAEGYSALSRGFSAAADLLERGFSLTPDIIQELRRTAMPETVQVASEDSIHMENRGGDDLASLAGSMPGEEALAQETATVMRIIEGAREKLGEVREVIPALAPADRPAVEAQYFSAVRDVERLTSGLDRPEYSDPAQGTIYADGHREAVVAMDSAALSEVLEGSGIDPAELAARVRLDVRSAALEAHWVAVDARNTADARGYDMESEEGARQAYENLATIYRAVAEQSMTVARAAPDLTDERNLDDAMDTRAALLEEVRELAARDHLSSDQQERLIDALEDLAGEEAVHELRGGKSDGLAEFLPDRAERLDIAEAWLWAEQSRGADRANAIEAVEKDREVMIAERRYEAQTAYERELGQDAEARRERGLDDGHEL